MLIEDVDSREELEAFYALYERCFPLPCQRESKVGLLEILQLNRNAELQRRLGPWHEVVACVRRGPGGPVVGGHNFGMTTSAAHREHGYPASVQSIYTFFDPSVRGRTNLRTVQHYQKARALSCFGAPGTRAVPPLIFFEATNPELMSDEELAAERRAGVDPHRRYALWLRLGFRPLDLPYVQPRLLAAAAPVRSLDLFCDSEEEAVPSAVLMAHLRAFVSISIRKGRPAEEDPDFAAMDLYCHGRRSIGFKSRTARARRRETRGSS